MIALPTPFSFSLFTLGGHLEFGATKYGHHFFFFFDWARKYLFIGAGAVPEAVRPWDPHWDPCPQLLPSVGDTLSQEHLLYQLL